MLHPLSGVITGKGLAGYAALSDIIFTVYILFCVLRCFPRQEQVLKNVIFINRFHHDLSFLSQHTVTVFNSYFEYQPLQYVLFGSLCYIYSVYIELS